MRTGGTAAFTVGQYATGIPPSTLLAPRRAVAAAVAPASGSGGQNTDLALIMADGSGRGSAGLAFGAHAQPICFWAMAIWNKWMPLDELQSMVWEAKTKLTLAAFPWRHVHGPATATVAACARIEWELKDASAIVTDEGRKVELELDPPAVVKKEAIETVKRWRWRRIAATFPQMEIVGANVGGEMRPIWSKKQQEGWCPAEKKAAFKSNFSKRQWLQARLFAAKLADTRACNACVAKLCNENGNTWPIQEDQQFPPHILEAAPTGTGFHR